MTTPSSATAGIEQLTAFGRGRQSLKESVRFDPESDYNHGRSKQVNTDQNGHYLIKDVPPGKYKVTAKIPSPREGAPAIKSDPVAVTLGEREHQAVDIKLTVPKSE